MGEHCELLGGGGWLPSCSPREQTTAHASGAERTRCHPVVPSATPLGRKAQAHQAISPRSPPEPSHRTRQRPTSSGRSELISSPTTPDWTPAQADRTRLAGVVAIAAVGAPGDHSKASSSAPVVQGHLDRLLEAQKALGAPRAVPAGDGGQAGAEMTFLGFRRAALDQPHRGQDEQQELQVFRLALAKAPRVSRRVRPGMALASHNSRPLNVTRSPGLIPLGGDTRRGRSRGRRAPIRSSTAAALTRVRCAEIAANGHEGFAAT